ncbi:hypothetical protein FGB62_7g14 [Gracilaria domingensis]|nr:hypothetical protein FGB62_7g14 [Gracilaria domingensis]
MRAVHHVERAHVVAGRDELRVDAAGVADSDSLARSARDDLRRVRQVGRRVQREVRHLRPVLEAELTVVVCQLAPVGGSEARAVRGSEGEGEE